MKGLVCSSRALARQQAALPSRPSAATLCSRPSVRVIAARRPLAFVTKVAAIEEQQTSYEPAAESPVPQQPQATSTGPDADAALLDEMELEELDQAQESLIKWMMFNDEQAQDDNLDEMVDYDEFADDEYEELFEEVEDMLEEADYEFKVGDKVMGTVIEVDEDGAYVEIGAKATAFCPIVECSFAKLKTPLESLRSGMKREFMVVEDEQDYGQVIVSLAAMEATVWWQRIRQLQEEDLTVKVIVESANRGGLLVKYGIYDGFVPVSQFGPAVTPDSMESLVGYEIPVKFLEVDEDGERLVFSNKRASTAISELQGFKVGDVVTGVVQSVKPYGAFVDLGGVTGLLHVSQISHDRIMSVDKILHEGDKLKVLVLSQDRERGRVTLSTKKLEPTPGDMLKDPSKVFEKAEEMAEVFRKRVEAATVAANSGEAQPLQSSAPEQYTY